jgi:hypothetical protein
VRDRDRRAHRSVLRFFCAASVYQQYVIVSFSRLCKAFGFTPHSNPATARPAEAAGSEEEDLVYPTPISFMSALSGEVHASTVTELPMLSRGAGLFERSA